MWGSTSTLLWLWALAVNRLRALLEPTPFATSLDPAQLLLSLCLSVCSFLDTGSSVPPSQVTLNRAPENRTPYSPLLGTVWDLGGYYL